MQFGLIVIFAGYQIGGNYSYRPEKKKIDALTEISPPGNLKELCSYLGVVNGLRRFIPDLSQNLVHMRELLKKDEKVNWFPKIQAEFNEVKAILKGPVGLSAFEPGCDIAMYMDFNRIGMGLALTQSSSTDKEKQKIIYCNSTSISLVQKKYPALYGEHTTLCWAILRCKFWLKGAPHFTVYSDQIALSQIYSQEREIQDFPEELQHLAIILTSYRFTVVYLPRKKNVIADFLSRNPIKWSDKGVCPGSIIEDESGKLIPVENIVRQTFNACTRRREEDSSLMMLKEATMGEKEYSAMLEARVQNLSKSEIKELPQENPCRAMIGIWDNVGLLGDESLLTYNNMRIVVPKGA